MSLILMTLGDREILVEPDSPMEKRCLELGFQPDTLPSLDDAKKALADAQAAEKKAEAVANAAAGQNRPNRPAGRR